MSRRAFFAWQRGLKRPEPVVFYDEIGKVEGKEAPLVFNAEIPEGTANARFFGGDKTSSNFGALAEAYPCPALT